MLILSVTCQLKIKNKKRLVPDRYSTDIVLVSFKKKKIKYSVLIFQNK